MTGTSSMCKTDFVKTIDCIIRNYPGAEIVFNVKMKDGSRINFTNYSLLEEDIVSLETDTLYGKEKHMIGLCNVRKSGLGYFLVRKLAVKQVSVIE